MTRDLRLAIRYGVDHVWNRGLEQRDIVRDHLDRHIWLRLFTRSATHHSWLVFPYPLLNDYFHTVLHAPDGDLPVEIHDFAGRYVGRAETAIRSVYGRFVQADITAPSSNRPDEVADDWILGSEDCAAQHRGRSRMRGRCHETI
jgi:hypothetical protein